MQRRATQHGLTQGLSYRLVQQFQPVVCSLAFSYFDLKTVMVPLRSKITTKSRRNTARAECAFTFCEEPSGYLSQKPTTP